MKSSRKDFPLRKAPATESTTTFLSLTSSDSRISCRASWSSSNVWSGLASTIWVGEKERGRKEGGRERREGGREGGREGQEGGKEGGGRREGGKERKGGMDE